jgi:hypothetical protein
MMCIYPILAYCEEGRREQRLVTSEKELYPESIASGNNAHHDKRCWKKQHRDCGNRDHRCAISLRLLGYFRREFRDFLVLDSYFFVRTGFCLVCEVE